jgi:hypothetical protein
MTKPASTLRILNWNVEWASPTSPHGRLVRERIETAGPDVVCVTEGFAELLPAAGHVVESDPDYGYPLRAGTSAPAPGRRWAT